MRNDAENQLAPQPCSYRMSCYRFPRTLCVSSTFAHPASRLVGTLMRPQRDRHMTKAWKRTSVSHGLAGTMLFHLPWGIRGPGILALSFIGPGKSIILPPSASVSFLENEGFGPFNCHSRSLDQHDEQTLQHSTPNKPFAGVSQINRELSVFLGDRSQA